MPRRPLLRTAAVLLLLLQASAPARAVGPEDDPWEGFNRRVFGFNEFLDHWFMKPAAKGYQAVTPEFVDTGVSNVFGNIGEVPSLANHLLQGRFREAGANGERLLVNSTLGLLGMFDVASKMGIEKKDTDAGLTLGRWGVESGPYVVLPLFGPSTVRDGIGFGADALMSPVFHVDDERTKWSLRALEIVDTRADLLEVEELIAGDRYVFLRNLYLQRRNFLLGKQDPLDDFGDEYEDEYEQP